MSLAPGAPAAGVEGCVPEALRVDDLHAYYGESFVLQGVTLSVKAGSIGVVLGRNGVGKTTLMRSIMGLTPSRRGMVVISGRDVSTWAAHQRWVTGLALVPQGRRIFPSLTVREHLEIGLRAPRGQREAHWSVEAVFDTFPRLRERAGNRAATLSGGERQMLAVGRALCANPDLLLMDEPTEGLSPFIVDELTRLIATLKGQGVSILLVEQNLDFALGVADWVHVMEKGRIVHQCAPLALLADEAVKRRYLGL